jgi:hypothetical protein
VHYVFWEEAVCQVWKNIIASQHNDSCLETPKKGKFGIIGLPGYAILKK